MKNIFAIFRSLKNRKEGLYRVRAIMNEKLEHLIISGQVKTELLNARWDKLQQPYLRGGRIQTGSGRSRRSDLAALDVRTHAVASISRVRIESGIANKP